MKCRGWSNKRSGDARSGRERKWNRRISTPNRAERGRSSGNQDLLLIARPIFASSALNRMRRLVWVSVQLLFMSSVNSLFHCDDCDAHSAQAKASSLSASTTVTPNPLSSPVALKCSLAAHFPWLSSDDESDVWSPDAKLLMKLGTLSVLVKQHSEGLLAGSKLMWDLSVVGQDAVANVKFLS